MYCVVSAPIIQTPNPIKSSQTKQKCIFTYFWMALSYITDDVCISSSSAWGNFALVGQIPAKTSPRWRMQWRITSLHISSERLTRLDESGWTKCDKQCTGCGDLVIPLKHWQLLRWRCRWITSLPSACASHGVGMRITSDLFKWWMRRLMTLRLIRTMYGKPRHGQ